MELISLASFSSKDFNKYKEFLKKEKSDSEHTKSIISYDHPIKLASDSITKGAGFKKFLKSTLRAFNPFRWRTTINTFSNNLRNSNKMGDKDFEYSKMAKESYRQHKDRQQNIRGWALNDEHSDDRHAVYTQGNNRAFVLRGTASTSDVLPDLNILVGKVDKSSDFKDSLSKFQKAQSDLKGNWVTVGHSLGGSKAMWLAQKEGVKSKVFNPGFNSVTEDILDPEYDGHKVYVTKGDVVSNSILAEKVSNLVVLPSTSLNPLKNHTIDNFQKE